MAVPLNISRYLGQVVSDTWAHQRIYVNDDAFLKDTSVFDYLPGFIARTFGTRYIDENRKTIDWFYERYGKNTVNQVLDLTAKWETGGSISRNEVCILMNGLPEKENFNIEQLARLAGKTCRLSRICFKNGRVQSGIFFYDLIPAFILMFVHVLGFGEGIGKENRQTIDWFYQTFGRRRMEAISKRFNLHLSYKHTHRLSLGRMDIEKIFLGLSQVYLDDMKEQYEAHKCAFANREFHELTNADVKKTYDYCIPLTMEQIFCYNVPEIQHNSRIKHGTWEGKRLSQYMIHSLHTGKVEGLGRALREAKKVFHRRMDDGLVVPNADGYRYNFCSLHGAGGFFDLWKPVSPAQGIENLVTSLGTQISAWESVFGILRHNIGAMAPMALYPNLHNYLTNPIFGFIDHVGETVKGLGFSQGGSQLLRLATLFPDKFSHLDLFSDPGVDLETFKYFADVVNRISLHYIWDIKDHVPKCGLHPGFRLDPTRFRVTADLIGDEISDIPPKLPDVPSGALGFFKGLYSAFLGPHLSDYTDCHLESGGGSHRVWHFSNQSAMREALDRLLVNLDPYDSDGHISDMQNPMHPEYKEPSWIANRLWYTRWVGGASEFVDFAKAVAAGQSPWA